MLLTLLSLTLVFAAKLVPNIDPTPLYLEVQTYEGTRELINLKYHLIHEDVPVERLWIHPFAIPILTSAFRSWKLVTTPEYDSSLTYEIHPSLLQIELPKTWVLPFGPVPREKLIAAEEPMLMTVELLQMLKSGQPFVYGANAAFTRFVDKHGLLQVSIVIQSALEFYETDHMSEEEVAIVKDHVRAMHRIMLAGEKGPNPFFESLFWTDRYRSTLSRIEYFGSADHSKIISMQLPDSILNAIKSASTQQEPTFTLSLKATQVLLHYQPICADLNLVVLRHGHPDAFLELVVDDPMMVTVDINALRKYLADNQFGDFKTSFLRRRLLHLLMQRGDRTVDMEIAVVNVFQKPGGHHDDLERLRFTLRSIDAVQACRRNSEFGIHDISLLVCDQKVLAPHPTFTPVQLAPLSTVLRTPHRLLQAHTWPHEWKTLPRSLSRVLYDKFHQDSNTLVIRDEGLAEQILIRAFKYQWPSFVTMACIKVLAYRGIPLQSTRLYEAILEGKAGDSLTTAYLLLVDPSKLKEHVTKFGWSWLANFYFDRLLNPHCLTRPYVVSLLERTILPAQRSPAEDRIHNMAVALGIITVDSKLKSVKDGVHSVSVKMIKPNFSLTNWYYKNLTWKLSPIEAMIPDQPQSWYRSYVFADFLVAPFFLLQHQQCLGVNSYLNSIPEPEIICQLMSKSHRLANRKMTSQLISQFKGAVAKGSFDNGHAEYMAFILLRCAP